MTKTIKPIPIPMLIISLFIIFTMSCGSDDSDVYTGGIKRSNQLITNNGLKITSRGNIPSTYAGKADKGMETLFALAKQNTYSNNLNYRFYEVHLFKRSDKCQQAGFLVKGITEYDQTPFDKDPTAGQVTLCVAGLTDGVSGVMVVVDDYDTLETIVRYEGEHIVLYHNDRQRFWLTAVHSAGNGHPILKSVKEDSLLNKEDVRFNYRSVPNKGQLKTNQKEKSDKIFMLIVK